MSAEHETTTGLDLRLLHYAAPVSSIVFVSDAFVVTRLLTVLITVLTRDV